MSTVTTATPEYEPATMSITEAARIIGISRSAGYRAADKGESPTIRIGGRLLVPAAVLYRMLGAGPVTTD